MDAFLLLPDATGGLVLFEIIEAVLAFGLGYGGGLGGGVVGEVELLLRLCGGCMWSGVLRVVAGAGAKSKASSSCCGGR